MLWLGRETLRIAKKALIGFFEYYIRFVLNETNIS
jgi:hypothetical protein